MKFIVTFKTPDAVDDALADCSFVEKAASTERLAKRLAEKFFEYGEYANIEIDTEAGTATVLEAT